MPTPTWSPTKAKMQLRLSVQRLRTVQQKREALAKSSRRDIALSLEKGKIESARIKVEAIINEDINLELLELLELYCELLIARFGLLDQNTREPDQGIREGVCAIVYAAQRTEVKELHVLRELLLQKYGREFSAAVMENRGDCVSDRVVKKLSVETPSSQLVDGYLTEISKAYGVKWSSSTTHVVFKDEAGKPNQIHTPEQTSESLPSYSEEGPIIAKLPDLPPTEEEEEKDTRKPNTTTTSAKENPEEDFESLTRRFQELKKR
ncbi:regulator of Vps4 activity in the MVB pathway-domain-containing protein [Boletus coccyginus]|nr:regulator of Vps4 activity in the MVB pathway-domain-containing protein [Boletus coccyginus]